MFPRCGVDDDGFDASRDGEMIDIR
ncbi:hypothetical protein PPSIR1_31113 [Plesiocystis pacifica SIR-1]|uniref:Uncharacterized protein n=1 Tax=Plesiocystis pacifica SIR-1 TaxID=391625 RepID=A6GH18_9BACT|nr:hypothetical protein PPSIR1_31113 [Plesiocystis pacifica SIR-1]